MSFDKIFDLTARVFFFFHDVSCICRDEGLCKSRAIQIPLGKHVRKSRVAQIPSGEHDLL